MLTFAHAQPRGKNGLQNNRRQEVVREFLHVDAFRFSINLRIRTLAVRLNYWGGGGGIITQYSSPSQIQILSVFSCYGLCILDPIRCFKGLVEGNEDVEKGENIHVADQSDCDMDNGCEDKVEQNTTTHAEALKRPLPQNEE